MSEQNTMARTLVGGDENSAKDMGEFVSNVENIRRETGACVLVVHRDRVFKGIDVGNPGLAPCSLQLY